MFSKKRGMTFEPVDFAVWFWESAWKLDSEVIVPRHHVFQIVQEVLHFLCTLFED